MNKVIAGLILSHSVIAAGPIQYLTQGTPAPYNGYIFTEEAEQKNRLQLIEGNYFKSLDSVNQEYLLNLHKQMELSDKQRILWREESERLSKQLVAQQDSSFWKQVLFFGLGCVVTTGLAFAVNKATK